MVEVQNTVAGQLSDRYPVSNRAVALVRKLNCFDVSV